MICGSGGSKSRLARTAGGKPSPEIRNKKLHAVVARCTFSSQHVKNWRSWTAFGRSNVEIVHAVVARSPCPTQNVQNTHHSRTTFASSGQHVKKWRSRTTFGRSDVETVHAVAARCTFPSQHLKKKLTILDGFWKIRCRNSARCCGAKPVSNSKCTKHTPFSNHFCKFRCSRIARRCDAKHISKSKC